nr:ribosomal protein S6 kinase alpha 6 [Hymenolepis microstoma]CUU98222.1 ribosomal protein S6 kinase alpha 6 [Hymenolepis microstoma]
MSTCDLVFVKVIAKGRYSRIYEVSRVDSGGDTGTQALKLFTKFDSLSIEHILREEYILRRITTATKLSPFVITYFESVVLRDHPAFLLSRGCGMDLFDLALKSGRMTEEQAKFYACELICGLEHLHSLSIVHCDIKPENILLYHTGHIMITDFDLAMDLSVRGDPHYRSYAGGTPGYEAPEILKRITCTRKSDIWSMAAVVADLVSPRRLMRTGEQLKNIKPGEWDRRFLADLSIPLQVFFTLCFEENYKLRPSIWEVKRLKFFKDVNWQNVENLKLTPPFNFLHEEIAPQRLPQLGNINDDSIVGERPPPSQVDSDVITSRPKSLEIISFHSQEDCIFSRSQSVEFNEHCEWVPSRNKSDEIPQHKSPILFFRRFLNRLFKCFK